MPILKQVFLLIDSLCVCCIEDSRRGKSIRIFYYHFMLLYIFFRKDQVIPHLTMYRTSWFGEFIFFEKMYRGRHLRGLDRFIFIDGKTIKVKLLLN